MFFAFLVSVVQLGNQILLGKGRWSTAKTAGRFTNGSGWWAKLVCQGDFTTIFIVNMETQWNIWNLDEIVNGLGMALVNWCQLWNGEGYQWNLRCTCWTGRMVSSKSLIGDRQGCRRLPYSKFVTHWYGQNDRNHWIKINDMICMMHWYALIHVSRCQMDPNGSQSTFYTGLQSWCKAFMLVNSKETSHAVATDVVDWALQQKIINLDQRRNAVRAQNDVDIRGHT